MKEIMRAAVLHGPGNLMYEEVEKPQCGDKEVLIRVKAVGLCGSDIRSIRFGHHKLMYPQIIGHEIAGEVVEVGSRFTGFFKVGDRLYIGSLIPCHECEPCRRGWQGLCENLVVPGTDIPGGYAEYMLLTEKLLKHGTNVIMPEDAGYEEMVLVEPLASVYACQRKVDVKLGDTVVVIGMGPVGCLHVELAKLRGASCIIAVEQSAQRLAMAEAFGADYLINSAERDPVAEVRKITKQRGADIVMSACPAIEAQQQAVSMAGKMGVVVFFGGVPKGKMTQLDTNTIHYNLLTIYGHYGYNDSDLQQAYYLVVSGKLNAKRYITHTMPLKDIEKAIEMTQSGEAIKIVLVP